MIMKYSDLVHSNFDLFNKNSTFKKKFNNKIF